MQKNEHLILRRSPGQSIVIGNHGEIKITYYRQVNGEIQLGIEAPKSIPIDRLEKLEKKLAEESRQLAVPISK